MFKTKIINRFTENLLKNTCHFSDIILLTFKEYYKVAIVTALQMKK